MVQATCSRTEQPLSHGPAAIKPRGFGVDGRNKCPDERTLGAAVGGLCSRSASLYRKGAVTRSPARPSPRSLLSNRSRVSEQQSISSRSDSGSILRRTARGAGWIIGARAVTRLLGFVNTLVLARLLVPADFGLVALGTALSGSLAAISSIGVEDALVREGATSRNLYDTGFTLNAIRGAGTALLLFALAWPAARFFGDPRLVSVILVLALMALCSGINNIGTVEYIRDLDFRAEFLLLSFPRFIGFIVTIISGIIWRSYWALLGGMLISRIISVPLSYVMHPYRPRLSLREFDTLWHFSVWSWAIGMARMVRDRASAFLIGRYLGLADVGVYSAGLEVAVLPISEFLSPLGHACFPAFAATRREGKTGGDLLLRVTTTATTVSMPAAIGLSAVAGPVVRLLLGSKWSGAIPVVEVLGALSLTVVLWLLCEVALSAYGYLTTIFRLTLTFSIVRGAALLIGVPCLGLMGAVYATGIAALVEHIVWLGVAFQRFEVRILSLLARSWRTFLASACMTIVLAQGGFGWTDAQGAAVYLAGQIALSVVMGVTSYTVALVLLWLVSGRPGGPETDLIAFVEGIRCKALAHAAGRTARRPSDL